MLMIDSETREASRLRTWIDRSTDLRKMIKYGVIGLGAVAIDLGVFLVLHRRGISPLVANSISVGLAVAFSFFLNRKFTFGVKDRIARRLGAFGVVNLVGFAIGQAIILAVTAPDIAGADVAKVVSLPIVVGAQYILNSNWTFASDA